MSDKRYFVMVDGRKLGPFDKRTITGMRVKKILTSEQQVYDENGRITTVQELISSATTAGRFESSAPLSTGLVFPKFTVHFLKPPADAYSEESFEGLGELRVQPDVLRVSGMARSGVWDKPRDYRIKVPRKHIRRVKRMDNLVAVQADALPDWPHKGFFSFEFLDVDDAKAFCDAMLADTEGAGIVPDLSL